MTVLLAEKFADLIHARHRYGDDQPYRVHLDAVVNVLDGAGMDGFDDVCIGLLHDTIEDVDPMLREMTVNFIEENFSPHVFKVVWALSGIGDNRKARNANAYAKIADYPASANYKVADRIANMENAKVNREDLYAMYMSEDAAFRENVVAYSNCAGLIDRYDMITENEILAETGVSS